MPERESDTVFFVSFTPPGAVLVDDEAWYTWQALSYSSTVDTMKA
jgi:hypothetical protein